MTRAGKISWLPGGLLLGALVVRGLALWAAQDSSLVLDERLYLLRAEALLDGHGFVGSYQSWVRHPGVRMMAALPQYPGAYQPPGYTAFVAMVLGLTGRNLLFVKLAQIVLGTAVVGFVYLLGRSWFDRRHGLIAGTLCALYPNLIAFTHYLWSETLFIFLFVPAVWLLTRSARLPPTGAAALSGVLLGLAVLTRGSLLLFIPLLCAWLLWFHRDQAAPARRRVATLLLTALLVILPWSIRNTALHGGVVLVDTNAAFNLWRGNAPDSFAARPQRPELSYAAPFRGLPLMPVGPMDQRRFIAEVQRELGIEQPSDLQISRTGKRLAWRQIRRAPGVFVERCRTKLVDLWNPTSFLLRHYRLGAYGEVSPLVESAVSWSAVVGYLFVMLFGVVGLVRSRGDRHAWLVLLFVVFISAIHALSFGLTRFRLPVIPLVLPFTAHGALLVYRKACTALEPRS